MCNQRFIRASCQGTCKFLKYLCPNKKNAHLIQRDLSSTAVTPPRCKHRYDTALCVLGTGISIEIIIRSCWTSSLRCHTKGHAGHGLIQDSLTLVPCILLMSWQCHPFFPASSRSDHRDQFAQMGSASSSQQLHGLSLYQVPDREA